MFVASILVVRMAVVAKVAKLEIAVTVVVKTVAVSIQKTAVHELNLFKIHH